MTASPHIESFAREPFAIGEMGDTPREAARAMGWTPESFGLGFVVARTPDGRLMRVTESGAGCRAQEVQR